MPHLEHGPSSGNADDHHEVQPDQNQPASGALVTFLGVLHSLANGLSSDHLRSIMEHGVADFQEAVAGSNVSLERETRAAFALAAASAMANGRVQFPGMVWVREPFHREVRRLQDNGSPVVIKPCGPARKVSFAVIAIPGYNRDEGWKLFRRERGKSQKGYTMVELSPDTNDLVSLGSDDTQNGIYGFTTLTGRNTSDPYAAYIDGHHVTVETVPGDLAVRDHSFLGTSLEYVIEVPL